VPAEALRGFTDDKSGAQKIELDIVVRNCGVTCFVFRGDQVPIYSRKAMARLQEQRGRHQAGAAEGQTVRQVMR